MLQLRYFNSSSLLHFAFIIVHALFIHHPYSINHIILNLNDLHDCLLIQDVNFPVDYFHSFFLKLLLLYHFHLKGV